MNIISLGAQLICNLHAYLREDMTNMKPSSLTGDVISLSDPPVVVAAAAAAVDDGGDAAMLIPLLSDEM